jgi:hypothetical protein
MPSIYVIAEHGTHSPVKIGMSDNWWARLATLQTGNHRLLEIRAFFRIDSRALAYSLETMVHGRFSESAIRGEWFSVDVETAIRYIKDCGGGRVQRVTGRQLLEGCPINDAC